MSDRVAYTYVAKPFTSLIWTDEGRQHTLQRICQEVSYASNYVTLYMFMTAPFHTRFKNLRLESEEWHFMNASWVSPLCWILHEALTALEIFRGNTGSKRETTFNSQSHWTHQQMTKPFFCNFFFISILWCAHFLGQSLNSSWGQTDDWPILWVSGEKWHQVQNLFFENKKINK